MRPSGSGRAHVCWTCVNNVGFGGVFGKGDGVGCLFEPQCQVYDLAAPEPLPLPKACLRRDADALLPVPRYGRWSLIIYEVDKTSFDSA
jgi:hypothetical protein